MFITDYRIAIYYLVALISIAGIIFLCKTVTNKKIVDLLDALGTMTLYILIFHFSAFKLISYCLIKINDHPISRLSEFPVMQSPEGYEWIIYTLAGILIPVGIYMTKNYLKNFRRHVDVTEDISISEKRTID